MLGWRKLRGWNGLGCNEKEEPDQCQHEDEDELHTPPVEARWPRGKVTREGESLPLSLKFLNDSPETHDRPVKRDTLSARERWRTPKPPRLTDRSHLHVRIPCLNRDVVGARECLERPRQNFTVAHDYLDGVRRRVKAMVSLLLREPLRDIVEVGRRARRRFVGPGTDGSRAPPSLTQNVPSDAPEEAWDPLLREVRDGRTCFERPRHRFLCEVAWVERGRLALKPALNPRPFDLEVTLESLAIICPL